MTFQITTRDREYAVDVIAAYTVTTVTAHGYGRDANPTELPDDFRDRIAAQLVADWAADCCTVPTAAERHLANWMVRHLLPDPEGNEQDMEDVLRARWTQPGRAA